MSCLHGGLAGSTGAGQASITRAGAARYHRAHCPPAHVQCSCPRFKPSLGKLEKVWEGEAKKVKDAEQMPCGAIPEKRSAMKGLDEKSEGGLITVCIGDGC